MKIQIAPSPLAVDTGRKAWGRGHKLGVAITKAFYLVLGIIPFSTLAFNRCFIYLLRAFHLIAIPMRNPSPPPL